MVERFDREKKHPENIKFPVAENGIERIGKDIDNCISKFIMVHGKNPNPQELKSSFMEMLKTRNHFYFYVGVCPFFHKSIVEKKIKEVLKERMKDPRIRRMREVSVIFPSTNYLRVDELKRHLRVYIQLEAGKKASEIIRTDAYYKKCEGSNHNELKRQVRMDREKAKRIIEFVERGIFPGPYEMRKAKLS